MARDLIWLTLAAALLAGCGAAAPGRARELPPEAMAYVAAAPAVYGSAPAAGAVSGETERLRAVFEGALPAEARARVRHDPALDVVAAAVAETHDRFEANPAAPLVDWLYWRAGVTARPYNLSAQWARRVNVLDFSAGQAAASPPAAVLVAYGVARLPAGRNTLQSIVYARPFLEVAPFQKTYAPGAPLTLQMRPLDASTKLVLFIDAEDGGVAEQPLELRPDGSYFLSRAVPSRPGRYFIEIRGRETRGEATDPDDPWGRTMLWVPIYVGMTEPAAPDPVIAHPPPSPADPAAWPAWIVAQYDAERARHGKAPITVDPRVARVAGERSAAAAAAEGQEPVDHTVWARLGSAGVPLRGRRDESFQRCESPADLVYETLTLPSARKRIILSDQLLLGVGISARPPDARGRVAYQGAEISVAR